MSFIAPACCGMLTLPKYIFTLQDAGSDFPSKTLELADVQAAKCEAIHRIADTLCRDPKAFWDTDIHTVVVANTDGLTLFMVEIVSTTAPVLMAMSPG
ncbi:MAG: DUF6894 family protein [Brevundimonas sp.]